jgi:RsiW-degrading membrane proteinase PrsW (M82 family)
VTGFEIASLAASLAVSTGLLVAVVASVWWFDRYDREPVRLVVGVFLWGAVAAPVVAVAGSAALGVGLHLGPTAMVCWIGPVVEELAKAAGVVLVVLFSKEFDNPTDGLVYGTAAGLGFAATENLVYGVAGAGAPVIGGTVMLVLVRTVSAAGIHAVASGTFGGFLGVAYLSRNRLERLTWSCCGLTTAVAIHAGWNFLMLRLESAADPIPLTRWLVVVPLLYALYIVALFVFLRSEQRVLRTELAEEVELEVLPTWVLEVIPSYRRRIRSEWWPSRRERTVLARLLTRLAFRKHAVKRLPVGEAQLAGLEVMQLRQRVRAMLGADGKCQRTVEDDPTVP